MATKEMDAGHSAPKAKALIFQTKGNSVTQNSIYNAQGKACPWQSAAAHMCFLHVPFCKSCSVFRHLDHPSSHSF